MKHIGILAMAEQKLQPPSSSPQGERFSPAPAGQARVFVELPGLVILEELARSPHGITYKAKRLIEHDQVAVKAFKRTLVRKEYIDGLAHNSETSFLLDHPVLVRGLGCVNEEQRCLLLMEYAAGAPLARPLKQKVPIKASRALLIMLECIGGLQYAASKGFYHGRLHPGDIMVHGDEVRIVGVGMGERPEVAKTSERPCLFEPLIYTAPEALPSCSFPEDGPGRQAVDVYALGAILFHLLTGAPPFRGATEDALLQERQHLRMPVDWPLTTALPPAACVITDRMLARNPTSRPSYDTLNLELKEALRAVEWAEKDNARDTQPVFTGGHAQAPAADTASQILYGRPIPRRGVPVSTVILAALIAILGTLLAVKLFTNTSPSAPQPVPVSAPAQEQTARAPVTAKEPEAPKAAAVTVPAAAQPAPAAAPAFSEQEKAARQLVMIADMLHKGDVQPSAALLKVVQSIAESSKDSPNGIKALVLAAEIQEAIARNYNAALAPPPAKTAPAAPAVAPESPASEPPAKAVPAKPDARTLAEEAAAARALAAAIKPALAQAAKFQYADLGSQLDKLPSAGLSEENKQFAAGFAALAREEAAFFQRCHKRLLEQIESSPRKESPVQVRGNSKELEDIVDFDEKGLKIVSSPRGRPATSRFQPWEKIKPVQAYNMLKLLSEENNLDDQAGLLAFCFSHGLAEGCNAALDAMRNLPGGREKSGDLAELCKNINTLLANE
jgi:serine/threonine-protein kinase